MPTQSPRQTAFPCTVADIISGSWVQNDGLLPSGIQTPRCFVSRTSLLGVIVDKQGYSFTVDDGTGSINIRSFDAAPVVLQAGIGDIVLIIARPREYQGERFLTLEICKKINNPAWINYRRLEIALQQEEPSQENTMQTVVVASNGAQEVQETPAVIPPLNSVESLLAKIRQLDTGAGADIEDVLTALPSSDGYIKALLEEGDIFELRPGRLKVLE